MFALPVSNACLCIHTIFEHALKIYTCVPTTAQYFDTNIYIYNHTAGLLHFSASFGHHQGDIWQCRWQKKAETCGRLAVRSYIYFYVELVYSCWIKHYKIMLLHGIWTILKPLSSYVISVSLIARIICYVCVTTLHICPDYRKYQRTLS